MISVMVVFVDVNQVERRVGPFNQGVVVEMRDAGNAFVPAIVNVASRVVISYCYGRDWSLEGAWYPQAFITAASEDD